jgi:hypothetical protein
MNTDTKEILPSLEEGTQPPVQQTVVVKEKKTVKAHATKGAETVVEKDFVIDNIGEDDISVVPPPSGMREAGSKRYRIIINESDGMDAKKKDVFVSCNGFPCLIQRGREVCVREGILNVLRESVTTQLTKDDDNNDVYTDIPRFSLQILGEVNDT